MWYQHLLLVNNPQIPDCSIQKKEKEEVCPIGVEVLLALPQMSSVSP